MIPRGLPHGAFIEFIKEEIKLNTVSVQTLNDVSKEHFVVLIDFLGFKNFIDSNPEAEVLLFLKDIEKCQQKFRRQKQPNGAEILIESIKFISDTLIISMPLQTEKSINLTAIMRIIPFINSIAIRALTFGFLLRGAITFGKLKTSNNPLIF
jgi:hypothetical protein